MQEYFWVGIDFEQPYAPARFNAAGFLYVAGGPDPTEVEQLGNLKFEYYLVRGHRIVLISRQTGGIDLAIGLGIPATSEEDARAKIADATALLNNHHIRTGASVWKLALPGKNI